MLRHCSYDSVKAIADYLLERTSIRPKIGITCGSGLGGLATQVENAETFEYSKIPNFPVSTGKGSNAPRDRTAVLGNNTSDIVECYVVHKQQHYISLITQAPGILLSQASL